MRSSQRAAHNGELLPCQNFSNLADKKRMKKSIYGAVVALLGVVLGVGGAYFYGLTKPVAPAAAAPGGVSPSAPGKPGVATGVAGKPGDNVKPADVTNGKFADATKPTAAGAPTVGASNAPAGGGSPVELGKPEKLDWPVSVTAVGTLRSDESVIVRSEQSGRIVKFNFREGQPVKKGQLLVQLDDSVTRAELGQANANLKLAKAKFDRAAELKERNFISGQAKDEAENSLKVAEASVKLIEARLGRFNIEAPFSGTIGLRAVSEGDYVKDGQDIVNLEKTDPIKVDFKVPELFQSKVRVGQSLAVTLDSIAGKNFTGSVYAVNPLLDAAGRAVVLRAQMNNRDGGLKPGMFARVRLTLSETGEAVVVPEQAVFMQGEEQVMYRVVDGRAQRTKVEVGQRRDGKAEIVQGISPSDTIVLAGWQRLREGAPVRATSGGAPAAAIKGDAKGEANAPKVDAKPADGAVPKSDAKQKATTP
jgi:membrane fusion protein, multidrug efflux system